MMTARVMPRLLEATHEIGAPPQFGNGGFHAARAGPTPLAENEEEWLKIVSTLLKSLKITISKTILATPWAMTPIVETRLKSRSNTQGSNDHECSAKTRQAELSFWQVTWFRILSL
jgi:hypothetical protein